MRNLVVALVCWSFCASQPIAAPPDYSTAPLERLVDDLALVDSPAPGILDTAMYRTFVAIDERSEFAGGVLGTPPPNIPPQMRELARRGLAAVPILIQHLSDARPTLLSVGGDIGSGGFFMFQLFADEYDPRVRSERVTSGGIRYPFENNRSFEGKYTVRVGDICYVLIGQIVNRELNAARYQPSAGLLVNSPIETPSLAEKIKMDWGGLDAQNHERSLLDDIRSGKRASEFSYAFKRLRFYYPSAYKALSGDEVQKRNIFEAQEASSKSPK